MKLYTEEQEKQASIIPIEEKKEEEEKKPEEGEEKKQETREEEDDGNKLNARKLEYLSPKSLFLEYTNAYPPELFSDENPNACTIV